MNYLLISVDDARVISRVLDGDDIQERVRFQMLQDRLEQDTGGDFEEIASLLKRQEICAACSIEGQANYCSSIETQKIGRRIARLIDRAK